MFPTGILTGGGEEDLMGRDASTSQPLLRSDHPDDHIRHTVLWLEEMNVRQAQITDGDRLK